MKKLALITAALFLLVAYSLPAYGGSTVSVAATAKPKITLNVTTPNVNVGDVVPEVETAAQVASVQVKSNKPYNYTYTAAGLTYSVGTSAISQLRYDGTPFAAAGTLNGAAPTGDTTYNYNYTILLTDYNVPANDNLSGTVTYGAVQNL